MTAQSSIPAYRTLGETSRDRTRRFGVAGLLLPVLLLGLDAVGLLLAFSLAYLLRFKAGVPWLATPPHSIAFYSTLAFWAIPFWLILFALYQLYTRHSLFEGFGQYARIANACTVGMVVIIVISFLEPSLFISRGWLVLTWLTAIVMVCGLRFGMRRVVGQLRRRGHFLTPAVIVGVNDEAVALAEQFEGDPSCGLKVVGFIASATDDRVPASHLPVIGTIKDLMHLVPLSRYWGIREIVVAQTGLERSELLEIYRLLGQNSRVKLRLSSGLFDILTIGMQVQEVGCVPLMTPRRLRITGLDAVLKSALDYLGAALLLVVLTPVLLLIAALVKLDSPGPVVHRRRVLGLAGQPFDAFKFRTMWDEADAMFAADPTLQTAFAANYKLKDDPRVTRLGRFLRRTSLNELPQLVNVLRGEMSLVGPRMIAPDEATRYGKWQLNLLTVKPGITGPWQVQGRSDIPYDDRVRLSMHYIRNYSIWLDLEILLRTVMVVVQGRGAY
jgi:exopolysaccharide biosynthesis polyprenyl glycosylphosphotransferase